MSSPLILFLLLASPAMVQSGATVRTPGSRRPPSIEETRYWALFARVTMDARDADKAQAEGKTRLAEGIRRKLQRMVGFDDDQFAVLTQVVHENVRDQNEIHARSEAMMAEGRAKVPVGAPPAIDPKAAEAISDESAETLKRHIQALKDRLGPHAIGKLEVFFATVAIGGLPASRPTQSEAQRLNF